MFILDAYDSSLHNVTNIEKVFVVPYAPGEYTVMFSVKGEPSNELRLYTKHDSEEAAKNSLITLGELFDERGLLI